MYLYGASGHSLVVKEILEACGNVVKGYVDDDITLNEYCGLTVVNSADGLDPMIVSIGDNRDRKRVAESLNCRFGVAIHPSAVVSPSAIIGEGTVVMAGAVINAGAVIGKHCIVNTGASVDHECVLGDYVHVAPRAALCGRIRVGEGVLIAAGASVVPCIRIGAWSVVGAGASVVCDVPENSIFVGVPARKVR